MVSFTYTPLKEGEIRVLTLQPCGFERSDVPLKADLEHVVLDGEDNGYEALSYSWGDASVLHPLACGGGTLNITTNLRQALFRLRSPTLKRRIWADAVCINQNDQHEKLKQIAIMRHIYGNAKQTIVWLGDAADDSDLAIQFFDSLDNRLRQKLVEHFNTRLPFEQPAAVIGAYMRSFGRDQATLFQDFDPDRTMRAIVAFMARPWFRRAWCIQEYIVSPELKMFCGDKECSSAFAIPTFTYAFEDANIRWNKYVLASMREDVFRGIEQMTRIQAHHNEHEKEEDGKPHLFGMLQMYRTSQCTVPEDKVYSLVGISSGLSPDFTRSSKARRLQPKGGSRRFVAKAVSFWSRFRSKHALPEQPSVFDLPTTNKRDLFLYVAQRVLQAGAGESLFNEAARSRRLSDANWPSWVPDWTESPITSQYEHFFSSESNRPFKAGIAKARDRPEPDFKAVRNPGTPDRGETLLKVTGAVIQEVYVMGKHSQDRVPGAPNLSTLVDILHSLQRFERVWGETLDRDPYPTGESWAAVTEAMVRAGQTKEPSDFVSSVYREYGWGIVNELEFDIARENNSHVAYANDMEIIKATKAMADELPIWARIVGDAVAGRVAIVTMSSTTAYVGLAPVGTEVGDQICILRSCSVPYVLRPLENGRYRLVGDCYIHGVMEGELVDGLEFVTVEIE